MSTQSSEEKNATMQKERESMKRLLEGAMKDDADAVAEIVRKYATLQDDALSVLMGFKDGRGRTALHFAAQSHAAKVLTYVLHEGESSCSAENQAAAVNVADEQGITALMCASMNLPPPDTPVENLQTCIDILLKLGARVDMKTKAGATALHYASGSGAEAVVRGILSDPKNKSLCKLVSESGTPLHWAAAAGDGGAAIIEHLVTASPETINQPGGKHQLPPLIIAVAASKDDIAAKLVEHGADCGAILSGNITIAHIAADNGLVKTLAQLVQNDTGKKCLEMRNAQGELPIDLAAENDYTHCVQVLMGTEDMGEVEKKIKELKAAAEARGSKSGAGAGKPQEEELPPPPIKEAQEDADEKEAMLKCIEELERAKSVTEADKEAAAAEKAKGNEFFKKKEWDAAIEHYTAAIKLYPGDETYYSNRAACYMSKKMPKEALIDAVFARNIKPEWSKACYRMAAARLQLGRFEDAAVAAWEGLKMDPSNDEMKALVQKCVKKGKAVHQAKVKETEAKR
ncbi:hypothetical protein TrVE_jg12974 [Triparma verrucosa]|uniref:Serine/threonine-protein kinase BSK1-like TPR repeats domain-containing protein n=1 Tax=Triparma verrucosa TaxID=1606542 RepID=A0A9W7B1C0_9STRA|nr:hypothetical protein TrVE_jg12974 [Triparma verrucosa]